jgi:hypothetical protein
MASDTGHGSNMSAADMQDHIKTWKGFLSLIKWLIVSGVALMVFLAIFRTHN